MGQLLQDKVKGFVAVAPRPPLPPAFWITKAALSGLAWLVGLLSSGGDVGRVCMNNQPLM